MSSSDEVITVQRTASTSSLSLHVTPSVKHRIGQLILYFVKIFFPSMVFVKFFVSAIIPPIADNIIPLYFTGNIPNESSLAVASQFTFISIILEVIQEGVGNSLFHFVGNHYRNNKELALVAFKLSLLILLVGGILLTIAMLIFTPQFVNLINTPESIIEDTKHFLYTSSFSFTPILLRTAFTNYLLISTSTYLVVTQVLTVLIAFFVNFFMFGEQSFSLKWGVHELGYYKIVQSFLAMTVSFVFVLVVEKMGPVSFLFKIPFFQNLKTNFKAFFRVSWGNFADSMVRNFFYFVVTLNFLNNLGADEAAAWSVLNTIIWGIILVPGNVVANYVKVEIGLDSVKSKIKRIAKESTISLAAWIVLMTILTATLWPLLASFFSKANQNVAKLSLTMLYNVGWIFIIFAINNTIDSFFLGTGKTEYVFYQSFLTNMIVYFVPWILYLAGILTPSYWWVLGLFIAGMLVDFCLTCYFCVIVWRGMPTHEMI
ncbi:uncharacterized protein LOC119071909 [Bradysia coprophila]|uniref:uncharacterized protein LOC119071909 n=1 Tax=Bradysia coprophila TaxID=38358 RepID=UPI00187D7244|nr:uncharacterized protein LOC119071909 [Bradysia coprophila]XP_037032921.1 uncharacterized protein LOC119071909 [Bradysia coprophila]XP_037032922.1 uncharacterized protein LOC119071909 [Bradysia coprophila]XP_037032923.1 uncharacterized protein LOC119071909 [Bradysia coprophila]